MLEEKIEKYFLSVLQKRVPVRKSVFTVKLPLPPPSTPPSHTKPSTNYPPGSHSKKHQDIGKSKRPIRSLVQQIGDAIYPQVGQDGLVSQVLGLAQADEERVQQQQR